MQVHQVYTESEFRNFTYLLELDSGEAIVIDPWDDQLVNDLLLAKKLSLRAIINTHEHWDHIQGNQALVVQHGCEVWAHRNGEGKIPGLSRMLNAGERIALDHDAELLVLETPGHTEAHLCFLLLQAEKAIAVFSGDTLFNAGVGHCRAGGDPEVLYQTIAEQFMCLADDVVVYPGHDYLENNLRFTLSIEPNNPDAQIWLSKALGADPCVKPLTTCIGDEKTFNTFFRLNSLPIRQNLACQFASDKEVFVALRALRDQW